ncbi:MAG: class I SAM-dependent methyltransferase [Planctomycetota bacterium]|nr:class I SAM-dependent methyltransferase [Planctomycetota bacterium]
MSNEPSTTTPRTISANASAHARFWWHAAAGRGYEPDLYRVLSDAEREVLLAWYDDTLERKLVGEMAVPMASAVLGFVNGSGVRRIVQLGHFAGYSCLMLGWALRRMGAERGLFSIDINDKYTASTQEWLGRAGLEAHVGLHTSDSAAPECVAAARAYLGGDPACVLIDSSHQYAHTLAELELWYGALAPGGLMFLHDASPMAAKYDRSGEGGVRRALDEWLARAGAPAAITLLGPEAHGQEGPYADPSGLCLIQKPWES